MTLSLCLFLAEEHGCTRLDSRTVYLVEAGAVRKVRGCGSLIKIVKKSGREILKNRL